jgi:hypothetical protein
MSTYFNFKTPITRTNLESIGVTFQDGEDDGKPKTWIVESKDLNYLHPDFDKDNNLIYGFTRYGANNSSYLCDILELNRIDFCNEYEWGETAYPFSEIADVWGFDYSTNEELDETFEEFVYGEFPSLDYYWAINDGEEDKFIQEWCSENEEMFKEFQKENQIESIQKRMFEIETSTPHSGSIGF